MKKILVVDDEPNNLNLLRQILREHYSLIFANEGAKAIIAAQHHKPDLILLDIMMPKMNGYEVCQHLKQNADTAPIPVIFVTAMTEIEDEAEGFDAGAVDYIHKPVSAPIVLRRIATHLSLVKAKELEESHRCAIYMLGEAGHYNDEDTGLHIWRMSAYAKAIAIAAGWDETEAERLELAAPMHDTGKIGVPDSILKAPRKLNKDEWEIMKRHCEIGYDILKFSNNPVFAIAADIAYGHHERWDGTGYPKGLKGKEIPESARIVAIADVFDALTSVRPYKKAWPVEQALAEMKNNSGTQFDPELFKLFINNIDKIVAIRDEWIQIEKYRQ